MSEVATAAVTNVLGTLDASSGDSLLSSGAIARTFVDCGLRIPDVTSKNSASTVTAVAPCDIRIVVVWPLIAIAPLAVDTPV